MSEKIIADRTKVRNKRLNEFKKTERGINNLLFKHYFSD